MRKRVLLINDLVFSNIIIRAFLIISGYSFDMVDSRTKAIEILEVIKYDLIICNYEFKINDDLAFIKQLKNNIHYKETPVILLTSELIDLNIQSKLKELGVSCLLKKPYYWDKLESAFNMVMA
jgi:CheY-like chemotaxis protein